MTALPPDPDPARVPTTERGGGVSPGELPPDSAQTSATSNADPVAGRSLTPRAVIWLIVIVAFVAVFGTAAILMAIQLFELN